MTELLDRAYFLCKWETEAHKASSLEKLEEEYPTATRAEIADAFDRCTKLIKAGCEWAEQRRGPSNDGTGSPTIDLEALCPGFPEAIYSDAGSWGLYLTK